MFSGSPDKLTISDDAEIRVSATLALLKMGQENTIKPLIDMFNSDERRFVGNMAIMFLKELDSDQANHLLCSALDDPDPDERKKVVSCFEQLGG